MEPHLSLRISIAKSFILFSQNLFLAHNLCLENFLGLCLVLLLTSAILTVAYLGVILYEHGGFDVIGLAAILMQFLEMALFIAFAIFVSTFSSSLLSIVYTSGVFFLGHVVSQLVADAKTVGISGIKLFLVKVLYYIFPNLEKFNAP